MKITIENTDQIVELTDDDGFVTIPARVWTGTTESGIQVQMLVTRIAVALADNNSQFQKELRETPAPVAAIPRVFSSRMVL